MAVMDFEIKSVNGHYEVFIDGHFYCSEDTWPKAVEEAEKAVWGDRIEA